MKHLIFTVAAILCLATFSAQASEGGHGGNGGGGIIKDGREMTFGSAGIVVNQIEETQEQVPGLIGLVNWFSQNPDMTAKERLEMVNALMPSPSRKYFRVKPDYFTPEVRSRLMAEYQRVTGIDPKQLTLFAVTDLEDATTYLLPGFDQLKPNEKSAILYHEASWLVDGRRTDSWQTVKVLNMDYRVIVGKEIAFQKLLDNPNSSEAKYEWLSTAGYWFGAVRLAVQLDKASGALNGLMRDNRYIALNDLLSPLFVSCAENNYQGHDCASPETMQLMNLTAQYPNSKFLKLFEKAFSKGGVYYTHNYSGPKNTMPLNLIDEGFYKVDDLIYQFIDLDNSSLSTDIMAGKVPNPMGMSDDTMEGYPGLVLTFPPRMHLTKYQKNAHPFRLIFNSKGLTPSE